MTLPIGFLEPTASNRQTWDRKAAERINYLLRRAASATDIENLSAIIADLQAEVTALDMTKANASTVGGISTALNALQIKVDQLTGWGNYADTAGAQALSGGVRTLFTNNAGSKIEIQKPSDVTTFWNETSNFITGRNGDAIVVKVQCLFTPSDSVASELRFEVDIGGSLGVVEEQQFTIAGGAGVAIPLSWTFGAYTLGTWEANGGSIYVTADGPGSLTAKRVVIQRTHKAR